jgi:hypothetical protein
MNYVLDDCVNKLGLVTVTTLIADKKVWNVITCSFYEKDVAKLVLDIIGLVVATKSLKIKSFEQLGLYFAINTLACSIGTSAYCFIRFFSTGLEEMLYRPIYGFSGVLIIILMLARQQLKAEAVFSPVPYVTYNNLPVLVILIQLLLWLVGFRYLALDLPFSIIGILFSWSFLRFFFKFEEGAPLGDRSDEFSFVAMFPEVISARKMKYIVSYFMPFHLLIKKQYSLTSAFSFL